MTKKDFFVALLKVLGLYGLFMGLFAGIPTQMIFLVSTPFTADDVFPNVFLFFVGILIGPVLYVLLIVKADVLVRWLRLEKGFETPTIPLTGCSEENLLRLGVLILGGWLFLANIPTFLTEAIVAFKSSQLHLPRSQKETLFWLSDGLRVVIGLLLFTNYSSIAKILHNKLKTNTLPK